MQRAQSLYFAETEDRGRGIFTAEPLAKGSIIEICPVIVMPEKEKDVIHEISLHDYYFLWGEDMKQCAIALGYGSLYNHKTDPNANFILDFTCDCIEIFAHRDIDAGEEITINYHGEPGDTEPLWFKEQ